MKKMEPNQQQQAYSLTASGAVAVGRPFEDETNGSNRRQRRVRRAGGGDTVPSRRARGRQRQQGDASCSAAHALHDDIQRRA
jgi:hypothetical protein